MNAVVKEERRMDNLTKSYLQMYKEYVSGYKQYKMEKAALYARAENSGSEQQGLLLK